MMCGKCGKELLDWQRQTVLDGRKIELPPHCMDCKEIVLEEAGLDPHGLMVKEKSMVKREETPPTIPDQVYEDLIALIDDSCLWAKLADRGFKFPTQDKFVPELTGLIKVVNLYAAKFPVGGGTPEKRPWVNDEAQLEPGWHQRADVKIEVSGQLVGLSLPPTSLRQLSFYSRYLMNQGLRMEEVVTRITSRRTSNPKGSFNMAVFEVIDGENGRRPSETPIESSPDDLPDEWA